MLRSTLTILNASGSVVGTATEAASTLSETYSGTLAAGNYYAEIASYGGDSKRWAATTRPIITTWAPSL